MPDRPRRTFKFIGCEIIYREACRLAAAGPHRVDLEFLRKGLHDQETPRMVAEVQAAVDAVDARAGYEAILLGYARCNDGLVGVAARDIPLVVARAHDCITFFLGSRTAYKACFDAHPGTYYYTTGWVERADASGAGGLPQTGSGEGVMAKLGLNESYEQLVATYGRENADFITESLGDWRKNYSRGLYIEMGVCDERAFIAAARRQAEKNHWAFEVRKGDWTLLQKLFYGEWDDDFVIVAPGRHIIARNDDRVLDAGGQGAVRDGGGGSPRRR